ncbi:vacuolar protein sorting-associated protein 8 homolog isoform X2 [Telopea speciosissima]|uniref:vacuolar protein sorting-associated protein 8 homolog isoform X2 n=1 Tax=Telopea speciosissima TaxID=54955 RepID=UPI001CC799A1|nr:vacuolar protein sorting-associated protein 8 homolog isoform X2 [Telopea speciosissima]
MTKNLSSSRPPKELLDLDSLLQTSSDDEGNDLHGIHLRTVDEILNDSDSSSSPSSPSSPSSFNSAVLRRRFFSDLSSDKNSISITKDDSPSHEEDDASVSSPEADTLSASRISTVHQVPKSPEPETLRSVDAPKITPLSRRKPGESLANSSLGRNNDSATRSFPSLFGGVKSNPKPGAALAAAAAASRSIPTPHAAAIKSKRANSGILETVLHTEAQQLDLPVGDPGMRLDGSLDFESSAHSVDDVSNGDGSGIAQLDEKFIQENEGIAEFQSVMAEKMVAEEVEVAEISHGINEACPVEERPVELLHAPESDGVGLYSEENLSNFNSSSFTAFVEPRITSTPREGEASKLEENSTISGPIDVNQVNITYAEEENAHTPEVDIGPSSYSSEKYIPSSPRYEVSKPGEDVMPSELEDVEKNISADTKHREVVFAAEDTSSRSDMTELVEDGAFHLENKKGSKRAGKKSRASKKPLELAEELEKKHASSGLHWEEGAAAQPMRLEGIRRGPPAVGYLQIDPNNAITRAIQSQVFKREHGSPQVLAVHANFIAVGMSRGVVIVVPSKYSAHTADNMDAKMLMLGSQGDKSLSPVTSMCFNHLGDLLLVGYGDGHVAVWDVQREVAMKVISGVHSAPVVHTLFLGQDSQVTRQFKVVTGDSKGLVQLHAFSVVPLFNRVTIKTQCLLDGQKTGTVLSASPLLIDDSFGGSVTSAAGNAVASSNGIGSMVGGVVGGVVGGDAGWKLFSEGSSLVDEGVVIFVTHLTALVVRLSPALEVYAQLSRPDGVREGSMPYTAWKYMKQSRGSSTDVPGEVLERASLLAIAWDRKVQVSKLVKSELKVYREWILDSTAIGVQWLDDQMLVVLTLRGQLCLFAKEGTELHRTSFAIDDSRGDDLVTYHTHFSNIFGNPEKAYHNCVAVRGATIYILGPMRLVVSRLLPWKERIQVLRRAGDWMGALDMAMRLYDGHAHGVIDLPRTPDAIRETIMPYLVELLLSYVDEVFSYISVAFCNQLGKVEEVDETKSRSGSVHSDMDEQFARVGGVAVEFCVHIKRTDILFDDIFSKFVAVQHGGTFLELLEPYILKDMLGFLPPEIMQALVEHYSSKGWLQRVEQCVLHMDISSLDFNQVVKLCREHGLYGALIYLFNRGLDDFRAPLEELLMVVRNSQMESAVSIGYRMLVYLKYCFSGLAFPPGHGTISSTRLPSLRAELVQFLLEDANAPNLQVSSTIKSSPGAFPNLYHLLLLDTEATLEVLSCAFVQEEIQISDHSLHGLANNNMQDSIKDNEDITGKIENPNMVQNIINTLVRILDLEKSEMERFSGMDDTGSQEIWPSKKDMGHLLEFIAYFVACKRATVSKNVLNHIFEFLTLDDNSSPSVPGQKTEISKRREKQVLALLKVLPETDWSSSFVLHLCEKAQFYQVCGLIHASRGHYLAALDSYMKDIDEPVHAFSFINITLLQLGDTESADFRSAVISRIPELVNLSREGTFFLVVDHFNKESHHILSGLRSHPKSLFLYLKTTVDVHLSGTLDFSSLEKGGHLDLPNGRRMKDQSNEVEVYLARISEFPKLQRQDPVHVTDEIIELYLELLCQYERNSVLKFLETFESYRVEHCLRLCQEYGVIDAAAFLLERVGDVGNALSLTLSGINEKFIMLNAAVERTLCDVPSSGLTEMELLNTFRRVKEVDVIREILHASIGLCQRNTHRLDIEESESLWFQLLDSFCGPLKDSCDDKIVLGGNPTGMLASSLFGVQEDKDVLNNWRISKSKRSAHILRRVFSQFIRMIVDGMIGYVRLPRIMVKLLSDNGSQEFGDFKLTILGMLGTYNFERRILDTAKSLIEDDTFYTMSLLKKAASHGYAPQSFMCCICSSLLTKERSDSSIRVFSCGHATHLQCEFQGNRALNRDSLVGCPVCMPEKKTERSRSKPALSDNGLVNNYLLRNRQAQKTIPHHPHEPEGLEKPYGLHQISRFEILSNLQIAQKSLQIENLPPLKLAPPAIYHEKVKKGTDVLTGESSSTLAKSEKPSKNKQLRELKLKGSSIRFPLKSSIFGNEKTRK